MLSVRGFGGTKRVVQIAWLGAVIFVYLQFLTNWQGQPDPEFGLAMLLKMLLLAGPACWVAWLCLMPLESLAGVFFDVHPLTEWTLAWVVAVISGYLQWFLFVPWVWGWLRQKKKAS